MGLGGYFGLFLDILGDWRIIAATLGFFALLVLLRYVGMVYRRPPRSANAAAKPAAGGAASPKAAKPAPK
jgi:hypothetical protein